MKEKYNLKGLNLGVGLALMLIANTILISMTDSSSIFIAIVFLWLIGVGIWNFYEAFKNDRSQK